MIIVEDRPISQHLPSVINREVHKLNVVGSGRFRKVSQALSDSKPARTPSTLSARCSSMSRAETRPATGRTRRRGSVRRGSRRVVRLRLFVQERHASTAVLVVVDDHVLHVLAGVLVEPQVRRPLKRGDVLRRLGVLLDALRDAVPDRQRRRLDGAVLQLLDELPQPFTNRLGRAGAPELLHQRLLDVDEKRWRRPLARLDSAAFVALGFVDGLASPFPEVARQRAGVVVPARAEGDPVVGRLVLQPNLRLRRDLVGNHLEIVCSRSAIGVTQSESTMPWTTRQP